MKKILCLLFLFVFLMNFGAFAATVKTLSPAERSAAVMERGLLNAVTFPAEVSSTAVREVKEHKWLWPITVGPRILLNFSVRVTSAVNDICFYPWVTLYTESISPLTDPYGIPEYAWQIE